MSDEITIGDLATLIVNDKNLVTKEEVDLLNGKLSQLNSLSTDIYGNLMLWEKPTEISSITSQSSLPDNYIFCKDKITRQRITLNTNGVLHNDNINKMISSIEITVNGVTSTLDLDTSGIVINDKTIDFNYTATTTSQHDIKLKLKNGGINNYGTIVDTDYNVSVLASKIFEFPPTLNTTVKNSPYDSLDITVGQTLSMTSTFSTLIHNNITPNIVISDGTTNPNVSYNILGADLNYSFIIANDADHSGSITLNFGNIQNNYSWTATNLLTGADHIYSFPSNFTFEPTDPYLDPGKLILLSQNSSINLMLDNELHSNIYNEQIELLNYKIGSSGQYQNILDIDTNIDLSTRKINISNINVPSLDNDIYIKLILKGPDHTNQNNILSNEIIKVIEKNKILRPVINVSWFWPTDNTSEPNFYGAHYISNSGLYASQFGGWGGNDPLYNQNFKDWIVASSDPETLFLTTWGNLFGSHEISGWNPPGNFLLPYRGSGASWYGQLAVSNSESQYFVSGNIYMDSRWVHNYWVGTVGGKRLFSLNNTTINNFRYGMGFSSPGTVTRVYCNKSGIGSESDLTQHLNNAVFKFTGYNSRNNLYNKTNGTLLLEVSGTSWMNGWNSFTTIGNFSHIDFEKTTDDSYSGTIYIPIFIYGS